MHEVKVPVFDQSHVAGRGFFFVGGKYMGAPGARFYDGQMFVEVILPKKVLHPYPVIMFHGAGQTNLNWLGTPDGRKGWADYFVEQGFAVYLAEQPARGRSAYHPSADGERRYHAIEDIESRFAGSNGKWATAHLHTQWPEDGLTVGTEIFDQFASQQVEFLASNKKSQEMVFAASKELLEKTGPAILLTHSQAGPFGWQIADAYPELVKGVVALEPSGPPFAMRPVGLKAQNYGLTDLNMHFEPQVQTPDDFVLRMLSSENPGEAPGLVMDEAHIHRLPNFTGIPVMLVTSEASYHTQYDWLMSYVLNQMGVEHDFVELGKAGIHGNSHFMMIEKNNLEVADCVIGWLQEKGL